MIRTPVVLTVFNRPEIAARVFSEIAKARPSRLYLIADAPRADRPGEAERCAAARSVVEKVDWDCEVFKNYSATNLGPKRRLSTGINWVFEREETAIVLEHDCLPHPTFFPYCEELLEKYRDNQRVMQINGSNFLFGRVRVAESYCFSRITQPWGFATWRRAWQFYDVEMKMWPALRNTPLLQDTLLGDKVCAEYFKRVFDETYDGAINTWDYQWLLTCWRLNGLAVLPGTNLISNIG
ncbi:MAG TPA: glycosyltransferase family 2 protein, partial [Verrucomicrobiae bacterium]|nr:glycosyltransferase family 2 protein [Verrucomicrobiae bacterium]